MRTPAKFQFPSIQLNPDSEVPLYQQIAAGIRVAVQSGELAPGQQLPPTRTVMQELRVSRNTAVVAFNQLIAEGVLTSKLGSGVYVAGPTANANLAVSADRGPILPLNSRPAPPLERTFNGGARPETIAGRTVSGPSPSGVVSGLPTVSGGVAFPTRSAAAPSLPELLPASTPPRSQSQEVPEAEPARGEPSQPVSRGASVLPQIPLNQLTAYRSLKPFRPGLPDYREFPIALWERLRDRVIRDHTPELLGPGDPAGYRPLREVLAKYLGEVRGIRCQADQIFVTGGLAETIQIATMVVLPPEGSVGVEEPGHVPVKAAFLAAGARLIPLLVDEDGAIPPHGRRKNPPQLLYLTPAHQFPLGVAMSLPRRLGFFDFVTQTGATILEDDYDREFCYEGSLPESLFSLDTSGNTLYAASFGKLLFPSLGISCLVVPESRVEIFLKARAVAGGSNNGIDQATLALFFREGHFAQHMRYLRTAYQQRLGVLRSAFATEFAGVLELDETEAGLQTIAWLGRGWDEEEVASAGLAAGLEITPLGAYGRTALLRPGLVLGFAAWNEEEIRRATTRLALALRAKRARPASAGFSGS